MPAHLEDSSPNSCGSRAGQLYSFPAMTMGPLSSQKLPPARRSRYHSIVDATGPLPSASLAQGQAQSQSSASDDPKRAARPAINGLWNPFADYAVPAAAFDEWLAAPSAGSAPQSNPTVRPPWRTFVRSLQRLGPEEIARRWDGCRRVLRDTGVTYNVYSDPRGAARPWELDALPFVIAAEEWPAIERAVIQRATLLNALLADLYGEQRLLTSGRIPPALVLGHPGFLRPLHSVRPGPFGHLQFYAADLGRARDGSWWVLSDRTQAPSGAGYALENRQVMSRMWPEFFRETRLEFLRTFFERVRSTLDALSPAQRDAHRIVLLTPGPFNETYFEHAYLARCLGITLAEGEDLTVRDNIVYLRTLAGLRPVDVLLRRVDDEFCDPLQLRSTSLLGVAGLVQAVAHGKVTVANALGSGLVQNEALMPFLPGLCRELLGEDLRIPSIATWWCGQERERQFVLEHLDDLVLRRMGGEPHERSRVIPHRTFDASERRALVERIRRRGETLVAQEDFELSRAPVLSRGRVEARPVTLRVFAVASPDGFLVMPGGLTRYSQGDDTAAVFMQLGGGSKDTWVLARPAERASVTAHATSRREPGTNGLRRSEADLPSRVADNLFWTGRYFQRAETLTRLLRTLVGRAVGETGIDGLREVRPLLDALATSLGFSVGPAMEGAEMGLSQAAHDRTWINNLPDAVARLRQTMGTIRDRLPKDSWLFVNRLDDALAPPPDWPAPQLSDTLDSLDRVWLLLAALQGMLSESTPRGLDWLFADLGVRIERASALAQWLAHALAPVPPADNAILSALLELTDSTAIYASRYSAAPEWLPVLDLLICDETHPRALLYQVERLRSHIDRLPRDRSLGVLAPEQRLAAQLESSVRLADIPAWGAPSKHRPHRLISFLQAVETDSLALSDAITRAYFSHSGWFPFIPELGIGAI